MRVLCPILASIALTVAIPDSAVSAPKEAKQTMRGKLIVGSLEGVIETASGAMYSFSSKGGIARKLLTDCNDPYEFCEAQVLVYDDGEITKVLKVRKVLRDELTPAERDGLKTYLTNN